MIESHSTVGYDFLASLSLCLFPCNQPLWVFYVSPEIKRQCSHVLPSFITSTYSQTSHCPQSSSRYAILDLWILFQLVLISQLKPWYSARLVISDPPLGSFYSWLYAEKSLLVLRMWILVLPSCPTFPSKQCMPSPVEFRPRQAVFQYHLPAIPWRYPESKRTQHASDSCHSFIPSIASYSR